VSVSVQLQPRDNVPTEINVIGCSVDEALTRTERFLDEALISEAKTLRVIHGYGTGQLRRAIADFLHHHPLVMRFAAAPAEQGGGGVTVVELKD
jgi:DNA mismatch repair protein MutS2